MTTAAILAQGTYFPRLRVPAKEVAQQWGQSPPRDVETLSVPAFDEDAATLAVEAARRAVAAWGGNPGDLALVLFATSGPEDAAPVVAEAVGAASARAVNATGSFASGVAALITAYDTTTAGYPVLVVAADVPRAPPGDAREPTQGAGAAAFVVAKGAGVALVAAGAASGNPDDPDGATALLARARQELGKLPEDVAFRLTFPGAGHLRKRMGDAGAAQPLIELASVTATPGEGVLEVAAAGSALALHLRVARAPAGGRASVPEGRPVPYARALQERSRFLDALGVPDWPMGAYVSHQAFAATLPARWRLVAQRCRACAHVDYPPRVTCRACHAGAFDDAPLSGRASLYAFTVIARGAGPSEFAAEQAMCGDMPVGVVAFEEGPRVAAAIADVDAPASLRIGMAVTPVFRRLFVQEGKARYGVKFAPAAEYD